MAFGKKLMRLNIFTLELYEVETDLRFLEGYTKAEKVKSDAIHGNFPSFASIFCIFEKNGWKKKMKISS